MVYGGWDFRCHVWDLPFTPNPEKAYWPTYKGNMRRDGVISVPGLTSVGPVVVPAARWPWICRTPTRSTPRCPCACTSIPRAP